MSYCSTNYLTAYKIGLLLSFIHNSNLSNTFLNIYKNKNNKQDRFIIIIDIGGGLWPVNQLLWWWRIDKKNRLKVQSFFMKTY